MLEAILIVLSLICGIMSITFTTLEKPNIFINVMSTLLMFCALVCFSIFMSNISKYDGYLKGQKDALNGKNNLVITKTYQDSVLIKSDTTLVKNFEY